MYVSEIRRRIERPFATGGNRITTTSESATTGSPMSSPARVISSPRSVSAASFWPVSRMRACGFDARLPLRTTFKYLSVPSRDSV